jgi:hypothetical protein
MSGLTVLVIDETLGENSFVVQLLEELEQVGRALVADSPELAGLDSIFPDVLVLGANWLNQARDLRLRFPQSAIIGRSPWHGDMSSEFFPWGDQLREPSLPITKLIPRSR